MIIESPSLPGPIRIDSVEECEAVIARLKAERAAKEQTGTQPSTPVVEVR